MDYSYGKSIKVLSRGPYEKTHKGFISKPLNFQCRQFTIYMHIRPKLCGNCAFPQNFHTRELGEISVFYAVMLLWYTNCNSKII